MKRVSRRSLLIAAGTSLLAARAAPAQPSVAPSTAVVLDDASRLNATRVAQHSIFRATDETDRIARLRSLLKNASTNGHAVCAGGARHSMGGQSLPKDGVAVSTLGTEVELDSAQRRYRVTASARWREVIAKLDPQRFSVAVMQSNNDFSVGGTLSVNAHGWAVPFGPFASTVRGLRLMLADGSIVTCSRQENQRLFNLVIGGYGVFGILIDADLDMVDNVLLAPAFLRLPADTFADRFLATVRDETVRMAYGRLSVARSNFFNEALLVSYRPTSTQPAEMPSPNPSSAFSALSRTIFRAQVGSEQGKRARWAVETRIGTRLTAPATRNSLLNYPVAALADSNRRSTDILHEYFVPPARFPDFLKSCRDIIPRSNVDLLNVTLRYVDADTDSVLNFATTPRIAAVMLFAQPLTRAADAAMQVMTEQLIDHVLSVSGSFYLPYRLHARGDQVAAAYPRLPEFIAAKRHFDPQVRFRNAMWDRYCV